MSDSRGLWDSYVNIYQKNLECSNRSSEKVFVLLEYLNAIQ